ncbi:MAG: hypothetical protein Q9195_006096 [Heterodermia aff. obscurata]
MSSNIQPPDPASLLPPLLACLPTGFASPRPPPALLPLLSPILRQRVQLLSATTESSTESWLPLLCWRSNCAGKLASIVESDAFELHPVSGEIEYGEVSPVRYRRLDEETLQARVDIIDLELVVIYLWCPGDTEGGGSGWRVSELLPLHETSEDSSEQWWPSIAAAQQAAENISPNHTSPHLNGTTPNTSSHPNPDPDDFDYWAQYDKTPGRTPAATRSPGPPNGRTRSTSEAAYFAQYATVQPELDADDPDPDPSSRHPLEEPLLNGFARPPPLPQPSAVTPESETVSRLEDSALLQSSGEAAVRQHVGTSIKSLFRLCRATGIERGEFEDMVRTEVETLGMLDGDE